MTELTAEQRLEKMEGALNLFMLGVTEFIQKFQQQLVMVREDFRAGPPEEQKGNGDAT